MVKKLTKMVVNVEKLLKMVENGDFSNLSKQSWNVENVGENIKQILHWSSFTLWILEISFLTQSFTNIFVISTHNPQTSL